MCGNINIIEYVPLCVIANYNYVSTHYIDYYNYVEMRGHQWRLIA